MRQGRDDTGLRYCSHCSCLLKKSSIGDHRKRNKHCINTVEEITKFRMHDTTISQAIKRFSPFDMFNDPSQQEEISPYLTSKIIEEKCAETASLMDDIIRMEIRSCNWVTLRIDGWTGGIRYEGVEIEYEICIERSCRLLPTATDINQSHNAESLAKIIDEFDMRFHFKDKLIAIGSDSASINIKLSNDIQVEHDPCQCHKFTTLFNRFMTSLPDEVSYIVTAANALHSDPWLKEYLSTVKANIKSSSPTRWFTVVDSLKSYLNHIHKVNFWEDLRGKKSNVVGIRSKKPSVVWSISICNFRTSKILEIIRE